MYALQRLRYRQILCDIKSTLEDMAIDPRGFPGVANEGRLLKSSASTPSLRSRESELVPMGTPTQDGGGGNVRVVVRVRGFLLRGPHLSTRLSLSILTLLQRSSEGQNALSR